MSIFRKILEKANCSKIIEFSYIPEIFDLMVKKQIGGNYPVGGIVIAKIDKELYKALEKRFDMDGVKIGDCAKMNNGWSLD